jgi:hypothetical protein
LFVPLELGKPQAANQEAANQEAANEVRLETGDGTNKRATKPPGCWMLCLVGAGIWVGAEGSMAAAGAVGGRAGTVAWGGRCGSVLNGDTSVQRR